MSGITPEILSSQIAMSALTARADAKGATASIATTEIQYGSQGSGAGAGSQGYDINRLEQAEHGLQRARIEEIFDASRASEAQRRDEASERAIERLKKRTEAMWEALAALGAPPPASTQMILTLFSNTSGQALTINTTGQVQSLTLRGGDQAVSIKAHSVDSVYTDGGHDAITIEAESVNSVYTDRSKGYEPAVGENGETTHRVVAETSSNDAVAIKARRADSIYTKGGNDAIAIQADLIDSVYAGKGQDAISVDGGIVGGIHGEEGDEAITVNAAIGKSATSLVLQGFAPEHFQNYVRPESAEARMRQAVTNYSDVHGGDGNDTISVTVQEIISIDGGAGNDTISIGGGTVGLRTGLLSGHDTVTVARGAELMIQIDRGTYSVETEGDDLIISHWGGSVRVVGYEAAAAIGVGGSGQLQREAPTGPRDDFLSAGIGSPAPSDAFGFLGHDPSDPGLRIDPASGQRLRLLHVAVPEPVNLLV